MKQGKKTKKGFRNTVIALGLSLTIPATYIGIKTSELWKYIKQDYKSEITRLESPGNPKNTKSYIIENAKTIRDILLYSWNDLRDTKKEYDITINKKTNTMQVYDDGKLEKEIKIGTGQIQKENKTKFGEFVTPNGEYKVINTFSKKDLENKFGKNAHLYGKGMIQLTGPWAPYIAIHGTEDTAKIGQYNSNGCINTSNENIEWLINNVGIGSTVTIK